MSREVGLARFCRQATFLGVEVLLSVGVDASISTEEKCGLREGSGDGIARLSE